MSGSSLDGIDLALVNLNVKNGSVSSDIVVGETFPYSTKWIDRLKNISNTSALNYAQTNVDLGRWIGNQVNTFLTKHQLDVDLIASHGHTVFHAPAQHMTAQIGDGAAIAAQCGITVIADFRTQDIALGGQGAPLAPLADLYLYPGYDFYLNLGGIANISCHIDQQKWVAFDIGAANQVLNVLANKVGLEYDDQGKLAASGQLIEPIFEQVRKLNFFFEDYPKSLSNQWVKEVVLPLYLNTRYSIPDLLFTACYQLAQQIARDIQHIIQKERFQKEQYQLLVTGGGAFNNFLIEQIRSACNKNLDLKVVVPAPSIINFKEAALMALMGMFRMEGIPNCISSVTGARQDAIGGSIHLSPIKKHIIL